MVSHANAGPASVELVACHDCDLLHEVVPPRPGTKLRCARCGSVLAHNLRNSLNRTLAYTMASLLFFVLANTFPILMFEMGGRVETNKLFSGCIELWRQGYQPLSALVFLASVLAPLIRIAALLYVLLPIRFNLRPLRFVPVFRLAEVLEPWSMTEVFMLGVIVAIIKLSDLATVVMGTGLYAFVGLILTSTAATATLDTRLVWRAARIVRRTAPAAPAPAAAEAAT